MLVAQNVTKKFYRPTKNQSHFEAVKPCTLELTPGKLTEITGRSGSGKSTLLYMCAGLLKPNSGTVMLDGKDLYRMDDKELSRLRNESFGVISQGQNGLYALSVLENVLIPAALLKGDSADYTDRARELLDMVGILNLENARMSELSGGEMRRMSIARALLLKPKVLFADEPTDDLDDENTNIVLNLLRKTADSGCAVMLVTHESEAAKYADIILKMDAGQLQK